MVASVLIADAGPGASPRARCLASGLRLAGVPVFECRSVAPAVRRAFAGGGRRPTLALFGDEPSQRQLVWELALAGLLPSVRLVVHAEAARLPYAPPVAELFARAEVVVTESEVAETAVRQCCSQVGESPPHVVRLPPVLPSASAMLEPTDADPGVVWPQRAGADDHGLVIGCWTGGASHEVASLALRIFHGFVESRARDAARLVLVGEPTGGGGRCWMRQVVRRLGLEDQVVHVADVAGRSAPPATPRWWAAIDAHLQPHLLADVPSSVRASCALGVPVVATRHGAVEEWLADAANLVPPRLVLDHSAGHRIALMDPDGAVGELRRLADDQARRMATRRMQERTASWDATTVVERWVEQVGVGTAA